MQERCTVSWVSRRVWLQKERVAKHPITVEIWFQLLSAPAYRGCLWARGPAADEPCASVEDL